MINDRKAVSPFISIILIVALAVIVAGIVITWTTQFEQETRGRTESEIRKTVDCGISTGLGVWRDMSGAQRICLNTTSQSLTFVLENKERLRIEDVNVNIIMKSRASTNQTGTSIVPGGLVVGNIYIGTSSTADIQLVIFIPAIQMGDSILWCSDNKITVEGSAIGAC
ncbi:hypothetical protein KY311_04990 [Candidatus Woesearchaeota archaeon]|nr:hypothetical protein [Candidatus Woesearchaeota archaeon]